MKHLHTLFIICSVMLAVLSCSQDDIDPMAQYKTQGQHLRRTIIAYITGDNNLSSNLCADTLEMKLGTASLDEDCRLVIYCDVEGRKPFIAELRKGMMTKSRQYTADFNSLNPDSMLHVMQWIVQNYPADEYATIIEGHGSGAIIVNDTTASQTISLSAYGYDNTVPTGSNVQWLNIPTMAQVFRQLPHQQFIFFDCCCMGNVETAYELRSSTDYVIAAVSETPTAGAPYKSVVPLLSLDTPQLCQKVIDTYISGSSLGTACGICMTGIKTSELDNLCNATRTILHKMYQQQDTIQVPKLTVPITHAIYYYRDQLTSGYQVMQDMKSMFRLAYENGTITLSDFYTWNAALQKAVVAKAMPEKNGDNPLWKTSTYMYPNINFYSFYDYFDEDHYGALSMIFPNANYDHAIVGGYPSVNQTMFKLSWCNAVGWHTFGW